MATAADEPVIVQPVQLARPRMDHSQCIARPVMALSVCQTTDRQVYHFLAAQQVATVTTASRSHRRMLPPCESHCVHRPLSMSRYVSIQNAPFHGQIWDPNRTTGTVRMLDITVSVRLGLYCNKHACSLA